MKDFPKMILQPTLKINTLAAYLAAFFIGINKNKHKLNLL